MAAFLKKSGYADIEFEVGSRGIFDVYAGETLIYSKFEKGRFPEHEEIKSKLQNR